MKAAGRRGCRKAKGRVIAVETRQFLEAAEAAVAAQDAKHKELVQKARAFAQGEKVAREASMSAPTMRRDVIVAEAHRIFDRMRDQSLDRLATNSGWSALSRPVVFSGDPMLVAMSSLDLASASLADAAKRAHEALSSIHVGDGDDVRDRLSRLIVELENNACLMAHNMAVMVVAARHLQRQREEGVAVARPDVVAISVGSNFGEWRHLTGEERVAAAARATGEERDAAAARAAEQGSGR